MKKEIETVSVMEGDVLKVINRTDYEADKSRYKLLDAKPDPSADSPSDDAGQAAEAPEAKGGTAEAPEAKGARRFNTHRTGA